MAFHSTRTSFPLLRVRRVRRVGVDVRMLRCAVHGHRRQDVCRAVLCWATLTLTHTPTHTHSHIHDAGLSGACGRVQANALVVAIQEKTAKAAALSPPTDNVDFENLSLNVM